MLPKRICARTYLYNGLRDMPAPWPNWRLRGERYPNDRVSSNSPASFCAARPAGGSLQNLQRAVGAGSAQLLYSAQIALSYQRPGRYAEANRCRGSRVNDRPNNVETRANRDLYELYWKGDPRPLHQTIDELLAQGPSALRNAADYWFSCALAERDPAAAERALVAVGDNPCWDEARLF